jgi:hypothetical protein
VDDRVAQDAFGVDDEEAAQRDALVLDEHAVVARDALRHVGRERVLEALDAALVARRLEPGAVREGRVGRDADDFRADALEVLVAVAERGQLRRADEGEVERVEEQHEPLARVVRELDVLVQLLDVLGRRHVEIRGLVADLRRRCRRFHDSSVEIYSHINPARLSAELLFAARPLEISARVNFQSGPRLQPPP